MADIEPASVTIALGGLDVVRDVSYQVDSGQLVAVIDPNGAGKTTWLIADGKLAIRGEPGVVLASAQFGIAFHAEDLPSGHCFAVPG